MVKQAFYKRKHTYHRENCDCFVRAIIVDIYGRKIVLSGHYAFEWSITIYTGDSITKTTYPNRKEAKKALKTYKRKGQIL